MELYKTHYPRINKLRKLWLNKNVFRKSFFDQVIHLYASKSKQYKKIYYMEKPVLPLLPTGFGATPPLPHALIPLGNYVS